MKNNWLRNHKMKFQYWGIFLLMLQPILLGSVLLVGIIVTLIDVYFHNDTLPNSKYIMIGGSIMAIGVTMIVMEKISNKYHFNIFSNARGCKKQ